MAGFEVQEAGTAPEVLRALDQRRPDVLVASLDLPPHGAYSLLKTIRNQPGQPRALPALGLTDEGGAAGRESSAGVDFEDYQRKFDWEGMTRSIARLAAASGERTAELEEVR